jgi:hypothetical protein
MNTTSNNNQPLRIFIGYDHRQPVSYNVLQQSIFTRSSKPVAITPICIHQVPYKRVGLTPFTFSRFLTPWLCNFEGWALFLDIDMLLLDDISKLFDLADDKYTVMVSKSEKRFEWASVMLFNCKRNTILTPEYCETAEGLHGISWCKEEEVGDLPKEWNHLVGYDDMRTDAKLVHYTQGVPCFKETIDSEYSQEWHNEHQFVNYSHPWAELMGSSVHAALIDGALQPKYKLTEQYKNAQKPRIVT